MKKIAAGLRALLAQVFLGWALALDSEEVMETVTAGICEAETSMGVPHGTWARTRGLTGPWGRD